MNTTIKISKKNQQKLFQIKNLFEQEMKKNISYNDVVEILIQKFENIDTRQFVRDLLSIEGILNEEDRKYFEEMRIIDQKRENKFISN